jgi:hypothetical protein
MIFQVNGGVFEFADDFGADELANGLGFVQLFMEIARNIGVVVNLLAMLELHSQGVGCWVVTRGLNVRAFTGGECNVHDAALG